MRIGIDLMGSDSSPQVLFEAVQQAAKQRLDISITLVVFVTEQVKDELLKQFSPHHNTPIEFITVSEQILMGDEPLSAVRHKKKSSIVQGMAELKRAKIDAFISTGNTGALLIAATMTLPMLPGIKRPALLASLPTEKGFVTVVDVGGNVSFKANHLLQFAYMGAAYQRFRHGMALPTVGLLNIGVESKKGTADVRQAYQTLQEQCLSLKSKGLPLIMDFVGNIEGRDIFHGRVDVVVTDGFTGNVLLKTAEGLSSFIFDYLQSLSIEMDSEKWEWALHQFYQRFNYASYPGAIVCGIDGLIIKCHGNSSALALLNGIKGAIEHLSNDLLIKMKKQLEWCTSQGLIS